MRTAMRNSWETHVVHAAWLPAALSETTAPKHGALTWLG